MRLAKLSLNGFKSFADPTDFSFDEPMIGIVGPNGCGKSNIVDAIKWVLGERSSKSLRGKEMIDVIFAGSASRKPSGMASVTLTFENPILGVREDATEGVSEHDSVPSGASDPGQPNRSDESASEASALLASGSVVRRGCGSSRADWVRGGAEVRRGGSAHSPEIPLERTPRMSPSPLLAVASNQYQSQPSRAFRYRFDFSASKCSLK